MKILNDIEVFSDAPEQVYSNKVALAHRKDFAQFFTPWPIAQFMANWVLQNSDCQKILDPALGLGVFIRAMISQNGANELSFTGYETDEIILGEAEDVLAEFLDEGKIQIKHRDFLLHDWDTFYDGIICNPPYFKFQDFDSKDAVLNDMKKRFGVELSGFTNSHSLFLLKSLRQLAPNGRAAFIMPTEFLNADYGKAVKQELLRSGMLRYVFHFDFRENVFTDALTTSGIFLFANDNSQKNVEFVTLSGIEELDDLARRLQICPTDKLSDRSYKNNELNAGAKWHNYYQNGQSRDYRNLISLSTYGKIVRGIATGDNNFFTFNASKKQAFGIPDAFLLPCITKANQAPLNFFTSQHFEDLSLADKRVFLFQSNDLKNEHVRRFVESGEMTGVHQKFLTSHRSPWYSQENRPPAPIWITVFNRKGLRFVRNEAGIRNLTTFHCLYLNMFAAERADLLFAYLITDIAKEIFSGNRREYGDGLEKFEPNDLNTAQVVNLDCISMSQQSSVLELFKKYRIAILEGKPANEFLHEINVIFTKIIHV